MAGFLSFTGAGSYAGTQLYVTWGAAGFGLSATEAKMETTTHNAGAWSKLQAYVNSNASSSVVFRFRVNQANGNQLLSVGSGTGYFEDTSNTDTVADGDEIALGYTAANGSACVVNFLTGLFTAATAHVVRVGMSSGTGASFTAASTNNFTGSCGFLSVGSPEANRDTPIQCACTLKNFYAYVTSNLRVTTTEIRSRKNGADGNLLLSISALATGVFQDTSNTDSLVAGDLFSFVVRTGAADANALVLNQVTADLYSASAALPYPQIAGNSYLAGTTYYTPVGGDLTNRLTTEAPNQIKAEQAGVLSGLTLAVRANTITATSTIRSRVNGANGNLVLSVGSGATGVFTDASNSDAVAASDMLSFSYVIGATGTSMTTRQGSVVFTIASAAVFIKRIFTMTQAVHRASFW